MTSSLFLLHFMHSLSRFLKPLFSWTLADILFSIICGYNSKISLRAYSWGKNRQKTLAQHNSLFVFLFFFFKNKTKQKQSFILFFGQTHHGPNRTDHERKVLSRIFVPGGVAKLAAWARLLRASCGGGRMSVTAFPLTAAVTHSARLRFN